MNNETKTYVIARNSMKKRLRMFCIIAFLCYISNHINASHVISLFLRPYPSVITPQKIARNAEKIKQPARLAYYSIKSLMHDPRTSGIFAAYRGYLTVSNYNGQILFPNKETKPIVQLLFTTRLTPIVMIGSTIHHWKLEEGTPAQLYKCERKQDEETENFYWETEEVSLPESLSIPAGTVWIVAAPQKVYVPLGISLTDKTQNFILPAVYVKKDIMKLKNALYILNIKHFFLPVKKEFLREALNIREMVLDA